MFAPALSFTDTRDFKLTLIIQMFRNYGNSVFDRRHTQIPKAHTNSSHGSIVCIACRSESVESCYCSFKVEDRSIRRLIRDRGRIRVKQVV